MVVSMPFICFVFGHLQGLALRVSNGRSSYGSWHLWCVHTIMDTPPIERDTGRSPALLWLIWIGLMLLTPIVAGISVWQQTHADLPDGREIQTDRELP